MPIYISSLYRDFKPIANTAQNGFFRPITDFQVAANLASNSLWNELTDEAENSQMVTDDLRPFLKTFNLIMSKENNLFGFSNYPKEYGRFSAARFVVQNGNIVGYKECDICDSRKENDEQEQYELVERYLDNVTEYNINKVDSSKWGGALQNLTKKPSLSNPLMTQTDKGFKVAPRQVSVVVLDYYVKPKNAVTVYTTTPINTVTGAGGDIIFDDLKSIPLEWPITVKNRLLEIIKDIYIGFTRDGLFQQISAAQKPLK